MSGAKVGTFKYCYFIAYIELYLLSQDTYVVVSYLIELDRKAFKHVNIEERPVNLHY
jgi:hypothetical protein